MNNIDESHVLDVLVVGAGPVGLTMAAELRRHGLRCRIIDKAPTPTDKSKALVIWTRTLELLEKLGIVERFLNAGFLADGASIHADGERKIHLVFEPERTRYPRPLMIPQSKTEAILTESLREVGITVERQVELTRLTDHGDHVSAMLRHADGGEEAVTAAWLIGCDGAHSTVRKELGIPFSGAAEPNDWILADVHIDGPLAGNEISIYWHHKGILAFFPFEPGRFRVIADQGLAQGLEKPPDPTLEQVAATIEERGVSGLRLYDPIWLSGFRIHERKVADYGKGRCFLAGDAAHIHSPAGGQGMNTGMQDAFNLAWKLALVQRGQGKADPLLTSYSQERTEVGELVLSRAGAVTRAATLRHPVAQFIRNHTASLLGSLSFFRDKVTNTLTELDIHYPHSMLNGEQRGFSVFAWLGGGLKPGDRLPDATVTDPHTGQPRRLLTVLTGTCHHLLCLAGRPEPAAVAPLADIRRRVAETFPDLIRSHLIIPGNVLHTDQVALAGAFDSAWLDADRTIHALHAVNEPSLVLIRPDGYISYRAQPASGEHLHEHLRRFLVDTSRGMASS
ncbi:MAG: FAD-dependent monooxygenase [Gemmataceae bacterium]